MQRYEAILLLAAPLSCAGCFTTFDTGCHHTATGCDFDGDGVNNEVDNCPQDSNPDLADADGDGMGDACDPCVRTKCFGINCNECPGPTERCDEQARDCLDDCANRECGPSPVMQFNCGTCPQDDTYCSEGGVCLASCEGIECGPSPGDGSDCGKCQGTTEWCDSTGHCIDDCLNREYGSSPNANYDCGECPGATDWCNSQGHCLDDCDGMECGSSPNADYDCGECGEFEFCSETFQCECTAEPCGDLCCDTGEICHPLRLACIDGRPAVIETPTGSEPDSFGFAVAIDGDYLVVGAPYADTPRQSDL